MRRILSSLVFLVPLSSCAPAPFAEPADTPAATSYDALPDVSVPDLVVPSDLHGQYYAGDGLGYNLGLSLNPNGSYECTWHGCLGLYGSADGSWSLEGANLVLTPRSETDMLVGYLVTLDIVSYMGHLLLVTEHDRDFFLKHGPSTYSALHRSEAQDLLR